MNTYEIHEQVYTSYLHPQVTHGTFMPGEWVQQRQRGYDTLTVETFGNVWTRVAPMCRWASASLSYTYYCPLPVDHTEPHDFIAIP